MQAFTWWMVGNPYLGFARQSKQSQGARNAHISVFAEYPKQGKIPQTDIPFFGDHVELSDGGNDFASTVGVGGVVGTQFVIPSLVVKRGKSDLAPEREKEFEKWLRIYRDKMLSKGQYLGQLYDIGFDAPETHAIRKDQTMYYAFFAKQWKGPVELRGLEDRNYTVVDSVTGKSLGTVSGPTAHLPAEFDGHLLLEVQQQ